jgi:2-C-methyl-D-erythritol 4-phosphate cytidylyltransferase
LRWAVDLLHGAGCRPLVIVLPAGLEPPDDVIATDEVLFTTGGSTRQESVSNALTLVRSPRVLVHDAVRPLAEVSLLERVLSRLDGIDGVIPAVPIDETIKRVEEGMAIETVDRTCLWRAQTPSAFLTATLKAAYERARIDGFVGTDEAQLVQRYGGRVAVVPGSRTNIKVTFPEDLSLVESLLGAK